MADDEDPFAGPDDRVKVFDDQAGALGTISALSSCYRQVAEGGGCSIL